VPRVFEFVQTLGEVPDAEMWEVFNMGCGFCVVVPAAEADAAAALLEPHHPGTARIGTVTAETDRISVPSLGLTFGP
jgi:phosphoribosylformylglycinamidine cyclo-ligase